MVHFTVPTGPARAPPKPQNQRNHGDTNRRPRQTTQYEPLIIHNDFQPSAFMLAKTSNAGNQILIKKH
jgi:hypothetical protein